MMSMGEIWTQVGSLMATIMFIYTLYQNYFPYELHGQITRYVQKLKTFVYPYIQVTFDEYQGDGFERSKAYVAIERYLDANSSNQARRLKATVVQDSQSLVLSMADHEEVLDGYQGIKLWWTSNRDVPDKQSISFFPREDEKRYFTVAFHKKHRDVIHRLYLKHVLDEGKAIGIRNRQRKLYTNNRTESWDAGYYRRTMWSHVVFEHPARFDTLAMDPKKKKEVMDDLITFSRAKDYYAKVGKAWKRGYLLYGPPGTGKSTMIAAMANLLEYDIYDLELTAVQDNTMLKKLFIETSSKSILVIEDIDCSLDLTGQREKKKEENEEEKGEKNSVEKKIKKQNENKESQVTLSGLLNFIDGLWSACGGERVIIFTTNYVDKLDPALIRRGRMDKHIELSYCRFEAFKVLAKNYLDVDFHHLFPTIDNLLEETNMTPADVAENLMPKSADDDAESCLKKLIKTVEIAKEEAKLKAQEEERLKAEKEEENTNKEKNSKKGEDADQEVKNEVILDDQVNGNVAGVNKEDW